MDDDGDDGDEDDKDDEISYKTFCEKKTTDVAA